MTGGHWLVASGNPGKLKELRAMLAPRGVRLSSQTELGIPDAEEPWPSFVENALAKARHGARPLGGLRPPTCGVMVGQGESGKPSISNQRNQFGQRLGTIRNIGVNMQVVTFSHTLTVPHHSAPPVSVAHGLFGFRPTLKYAPRVG